MSSAAAMKGYATASTPRHAPSRGLATHRIRWPAGHCCDVCRESASTGHQSDRARGRASRRPLPAASDASTRDAAHACRARSSALSRAHTHSNVHAPSARERIAAVGVCEDIICTVAYRRRRLAQLAIGKVGGSTDDDGGIALRRQRTELGDGHCSGRGRVAADNLPRTRERAHMSVCVRVRGERTGHAHRRAQ